MTDEFYFDKASKLPPGIALATLVSSQDQCCREDCDSWRTIYVDIIGHDEEDEDEPDLLRFSICMTHLGEFVDDMILRAPGTLLDMGGDEDDNCGDPDCPVHGYLNEEEDDDEDSDT